MTSSADHKSRSLLRSASSFASMTFISRLLGFVRDMVIAQLFGASGEVDAFLVAFKIPNFMRRLFAEGAFSQAFVPVLANIQATQSAQETKLFIGKVAGTLGLFVLVFTALAILVSPAFVLISAPGFTQDPSRFQLTSEMLRLTFPYLAFISLTALCAAVLNCYGYFAAPAFTPVLLNVSLLGFALFAAPYFTPTIKVLAVGVLFAGVAQLLFQIPWLWQANLMFRPRFAWQDPEVKKVMRLMVPALFGVSVTQINLYMDTLFATFLATGSVAWLYFSLQLCNFPLGIFGVGIATVLTPKLSQQHAQQLSASFQASIDWGCRMVLLLAIPAMFGLMILAKPLLICLFHYGKFTTTDVNMAALSLRAFAAGLPAFMLVKVFTSVYYARQEITTPVKIAALATGVNLVLNLLLIFPLAHLGLALSTSIAQSISAVLLFRLLTKQVIYKTQASWKAFFLQCAIANVLMLLGLYYLHTDSNVWLQWSAFERAAELSKTIAFALGLYGFGLFASGFRLQSIRVA
jgi:putative peptidoglycan lipid II flippase